jgi:AP-1 complex subunit mu
VYSNAGYGQVNADGNVIRSEILGAVKMKCYLSGMPELRLGLNDKVMFESTGRSESISYSMRLNVY